MDLLYDQRLYYWVVSAALCGALGSWIGTRSNMDEWVGAIMGIVFSASISLGFSEGASGILPVSLIVLILFVTFSVLLGRKTFVAVKVATLTLLVSVLFHYVAFGGQVAAHWASFP